MGQNSVVLRLLRVGWPLGLLWGPCCCINQLVFPLFSATGLKTDRKPFSCLRLQGIGAGKRGGGVHQTSLALSISGTFHVNGICGCKRELEMEHSWGSEGGRGQSTVYSGLAKRVCIQKDGVGFLTSEPETAMSQWSLKRVIWTLIVMAKNEREKNPGASLEPMAKTVLPHMSHINTHTHICNIEKWYWWTYLQGRNRDSDIENRLMDTVGKGEGEMNWESSIETYTLPRVKETANGKLPDRAGSSAWCSVTA